MSESTTVLNADTSTDFAAAEELLPLVYQELRRLAAATMASESSGHTLQPTALVHEAWLRLMAGGGERNWKDRAYFFSAAAEAMRRILIDHARRKSRAKHGGQQQRLDLESLDLSAAPDDEKVLLVNTALEELEGVHPERARVVVLKFFGGMTNKQAAETIGISERSVNRHWLCARTWLFKKIENQMSRA
jgi:RNA polymerase sigma factor (TIGR02999 family)